MDVNRFHSTAILFGLHACAFLSLVGCGGSDHDATPQDRPTTVDTGTPAPKIEIPASDPQEEAARKARSAAEARQAEIERLRNSADPGDIFTTVEKAENFEIVSAGPSPNEFVVLALPDDAPADAFLAVAANEQRTAESFRKPRPTIKLPAGFAILNEAGYTASGLPLRIRCEKDGAVMALVPAGFFERGKDQATADAGPAHQVYLDPFYIDTTEVTLRRYRKYLNDGSRGAQRPEPPLNASSPDDHPAVGIRWRDARDYAQWAGKDLPTEAEWEKAARGENGFDFPWGSGRAVWPRERQPGQIDAVGSFPSDRSPYGVYDLAGNAAEWCQDFYSDHAYEVAAANRMVGIRNPTGPRRPSSPNQRVIKGNSPTWAVWHRSGLNLREQVPQVGFRCVLRIPAEED